MNINLFKANMVLSEVLAMRYIKLLIAVLLVTTMFGSCGKTSTEISDTLTESDTTATLTIDISTTEISTTQANCTEETTRESLISKVANYKDGYLYGFDSSEIPMIFCLGNGLYGELVIYKFIENDFICIGSIPYEHWKTDWISVPDLTLYYDKSDNEHFYVNEYDYGFKYGITAEVNKYVFKDNELMVTNIARCDITWLEAEKTLEFTSNKLFSKDNTPIGIYDVNEVTHYYDGVEEYLSQFEKIKEITYEELTAVSIEDVINSGTLADYLP